MAKNFLHRGDVLTLVAPTGGVVSSQLYIINALPVVAITSADEGIKFTARDNGVFSFPKDTNVAVNQCERAYYDSTNAVVTNVDTNNTAIGYFEVSAVASDTTATVKLK